MVIIVLNGNRRTNFVMTHPSNLTRYKAISCNWPSNCGRVEVIVGCATLQVLTSSHHMHISKYMYLHTHIIPTHTCITQRLHDPNTHITQHTHHPAHTSPSTHITQHTHHPSTHIIPAHTSSQHLHHPSVLTSSQHTHTPVHVNTHSHH